MSKAKKIYITLGVLAGIILFGTLFYVAARMIVSQGTPAANDGPAQTEQVAPWNLDDLKEGMTPNEVSVLAGEPKSCFDRIRQSEVSIEDPPENGWCMYSHYSPGPCRSDYMIRYTNGRVVILEESSLNVQVGCVHTPESESEKIPPVRWWEFWK